MLGRRAVKLTSGVGSRADPRGRHIPLHLHQRGRRHREPGQPHHPRRGPRHQYRRAARHRLRAGRQPVTHRPSRICRCWSTPTAANCPSGWTACRCAPCGRTAWSRPPSSPTWRGSAPATRPRSPRSRRWPQATTSPASRARRRVSTCASCWPQPPRPARRQFEIVHDRLPPAATPPFWDAVRGNLDLLGEARHWWDVVAGDMVPPVLEGQADFFRDALASCRRSPGMRPPGPAGRAR